MTADDLRVLHGDALDLLRADALGYPHALGYHPDRLIPDASVDAIVTDPPYGLEFMGKDWDAPWRYGFGATGYTDAERMARPNFGSTRNPMCRTCRKHQRGTKRCACESPDYDETPADSSRLFGAWCEAWARECLRVLKPGGYLLAFGGTRTVHRLTTGIEDAGFEIRDGIDWLYGSGFPKSLDVSKAIDKAAGAQREVVGKGINHDAKVKHGGTWTGGVYAQDQYTGAAGPLITAPATEDAARWAGWGTALKPAREPIVVARKPLAGTVAANVLAYGTGALNIDACRVEVTDAAYAANCAGDRGHADNRTRDLAFRMGAGTANDAGRWPTNVILSHAPLLDDAGAIVGDACAGGCVPGCPVAELDAQSGVLRSGANPTRRGSDKFRDAYGEFRGQAECAPARGADAGGASRFFPVFRYQAKAPARERPKVNGVAHPTVKPVDLMRWLVRLVCQRGGTVLDLFAGSGTTGEACIAEGMACVLIEREADYLPLIDARTAGPAQPVLI